jgi:hypothetical protein
MYKDGYLYLSRGAWWDWRLNKVLSFGVFKEPMLPGCMSLHGTLSLKSWLWLFAFTLFPPPDRLLAAAANRIIIATQSYDPPVLVHCVPVLFSILHRRNHLSQISSFSPPWLASLFWKGFSSRIRKANKKIYTAFLTPSPNSLSHG